MKKLKAILLISILLAQQVSIFAAFTEKYIRTTGSDLNSGSTNTDAATFTYAAGTFVRATGVFTVASGNPLTDGVAVGDYVSIYTTAAATQPGLIARVEARDATTIDVIVTTTISGAVANVSEGAGASTLKVGGALASWQVAVGANMINGAIVNVAGDPVRLNVQVGTYEVDAAMTFTGVLIRIQGYTTTPGDGGMPRVFGNSDALAAPYIILTASGAGTQLYDLWFDDNGGTTGGQTSGNDMVVLSGAAARVVGCRFSDSYRSGLRISAGGYQVVRTEAYGCNRDDAAGFGAFEIPEEGTWDRVIAHHNTAGTDSIGFSVETDNTEPVTFINCIAAKNGGNGWDKSGSSGAVTMIGCIAYDNGDDGISAEGTITTSSNWRIQNSILMDNVGFGVLTTSGHMAMPELLNNAFFGNTVGETTGINSSFISGSITLTGDPFVDAENGDFRLNNTAGAGAACRAAGIATWLIDTTQFTSGASMVGYPDIGAAQHQDSGGGGGGTRVYVGN